MPKVNFREIQDRFTHIDAELVRATSTFGPGGGSVEIAVSLYPWWEHPLYLDARARGATWGFSYEPAEARKTVTVHAVRPTAARLSGIIDVVDWTFTESHPLLWDSEQEGSVVVNGDFDRNRLVEELLALSVPFADRDYVERMVGRSTWTAPFVMHLPSSWMQHAIDALGRLGVPTFAPYEAAKPKRAVCLLIDGIDFVMAEDFEVELPEFEHRPEWFSV